MTLRSPVLLAFLATGIVLHAETAAPTPAAPADTTAAAPKLQGRIENDRYHAPGEVFSIPVPVLHGENQVVMDNGEIVVFKDKVSTLLTIAAFPMPPIAQWEYKSTPPKDYLIQFFRDNILRDYRGEFPDSSIESARFLPDVSGGAMVAFTLLPGGSAFTSAEPRPPTAPPAVAKRGHLVFVHDNRVIVIAVELAERITHEAKYTLTTPEEDRILFDRLATVFTALRFGPDAQPAVEDDDESDE